ncbi:hypothetical protein CABS01_16118 [Colletotrichum abscissum]|uniref:Uncharacterized protein n=1 Tax=Colletotrichum abscissum TaxID=1671311 RepID=A0A9P9WZK2_9PEZI|nr:uncharacterized protein CABS01_16118 [Colletotrichum abscissum]KAI3527957.1 hypothetical protein CABS02_15242 [Colletotrichum abscissum]KAK1472900.1 hypothetical protein CABS01_16118 [Colletotrichum abscissum]
MAVSINFMPVFAEGEEERLRNIAVEALAAMYKSKKDEERVARGVGLISSTSPTQDPPPEPLASATPAITIGSRAPSREKSPSPVPERVRGFTAINRPAIQQSQEAGSSNGSRPAPRRPLPTSRPKKRQNQEVNEENTKVPSPPAVEPAAEGKAALVARKKMPTKPAAAAKNNTRTNAATPADKKPQSKATSGEREICKCSKCVESNPEGIEQCAKTKKEHSRSDKERNKGMKPAVPCDRCLQNNKGDECFYSGGKVCSRCMKLKERCSLNPVPGKGRKRDQDKVKRGQKKTAGPARDKDTDEAEEVLEVVEPPNKKARTRASKKTSPAARQSPSSPPARDKTGEPPDSSGRERSSSDDGSRTIDGSPSSSGATAGEREESSSSEPCGSPPGKGRVQDSQDS